MSTLFAISLTTGLLSGVWGWVAVSLGLLSWAGFLGCTSYFASPTQGVKGLAISLLTNLTGIGWALLIIYGSQWFGSEIIGYMLTGIVSFFMCIQAQKSWLSFIPGTFIGACATFAANGNWQLVIPSLLIGGVFGYLMKASGVWLQARSEAKLVAAQQSH
ncbi:MULTISPECIES: DUF1097 domain-containing protein [Vibrio]|uniref:DUF1097 domain-containing protein n=1 Tax=Vibrio algicola TaxID=2662262 RepID=A0A5Q0TKX9_9VIBR|nr:MULTISPECIES: DUF1097 domain-containing protein [Vibrio]MBD1577044.1 DUF1097 domain-containing protein [Vibrio sp. S11_S32]